MIVIENDPQDYHLVLNKKEERKIKVLAKQNDVNVATVIKRVLEYYLELMGQLPLPR